jgi:starch-binding outer membrane protein, SusD/RagB family
MRKKIYFILGFLSVLALVACEDLDVENINQPKFDDVNTPEQVNAAVGGLFNSWFITATNYDGPGLALLMTSDVGTCSWGNQGMRDLSSEPRITFNNTPAYPNMKPFEEYYKRMYATSSAATNALKAMSSDKNNKVITPARAKAVAKFVQATAIGSIGMLYDKGFVVTEHTDLAQEIPMLGYAAVIDSAVAILNSVITLCESNTFTIDKSWIPVEFTFTNVHLGQLANTMAARLLVYKSRNATQNAANDWNKIKGYAEKGITYNFDLYMDDVSWYDLLKTYAVYSGWGRIDMRVINMMDPNMPKWFPASGNIADLPNSGKATSVDKRLESDFEYIPGQDFLSERGIYHFSTYRYSRLDYYLDTWMEYVPYIHKAENDMILAEAYVRTGNLQGAADILNNPGNTRKLRGELPDVAVNETALLNAIYYEKTIECILSGENVEFYDMRRRNLLQKGTFLHLPVVAQQLEILQVPFYSFGGDQGVAGEDVSTGGWEVGSNRPNY